MRHSHFFLILGSFAAGLACAFGVAAVFPLSPRVNSRPIVDSDMNSGIIESGKISPAAVENSAVPADTFVPVKENRTAVEENVMEYPVLAEESEKYGKNVRSDVAMDVPTDRGAVAMKTVTPNILYFGVDHYPLSPNTLRMLEQYKTKTATAVTVVRHGVDRTGNDDSEKTGPCETSRWSDSPLDRVHPYQIPRPIDRMVPEKDAEKDTTAVSSPSSTSASYFRKR